MLGKGDPKLDSSLVTRQLTDNTPVVVDGRKKR